jgi:sec-independent protein translocase protein TatA
MPFNLGGPELIIILVIVLIVFGAGKLPNVMRDVGRGVREFKRAQEEEEAAPSTMQSTGAAVPPATPSSSTTSALPANGPVARAPETTNRA